MFIGPDAAEKVLPLGEEHNLAERRQIPADLTEKGEQISPTIVRNQKQGYRTRLSEDMRQLPGTQRWVDGDER